MKLWAGRFQKETDTLVNDFNSSIQFDARLYKQDIAGSIAHAQMLGKQGIIEEHEVEAIVDGLKAILADIEADKVEFSLDNEDIHMNIEAMLTERIGDAGKRLHTARSRNDQVAVDTRLYVKQEIPVIIDQILNLEQVLVERAKEHTDTVMPGYTHLQRAQPTTFAHYMMAYANMFKRDVTRLEDCLERMDECPLGAGALASWAFPCRSPAALFIAVGWLSQLVPWMFIGRITFAYHYLPSVLFLILALCYVFYSLSEQEELIAWKPAMYAVTAGAAALYALFYPGLVGIQIPSWYGTCLLRGLPSWPF